MSRYVEVGVPEIGRAQLVEALRALDLPFVDAGEDERIMLVGSLECAGQPVDLRCETGVAGSVEDFGFVCEGGRIVLVCGEHDRRLLERELLPRVRHAVTRALTLELAERAGLAVDEQLEADGTRRLALKRRP